MGSQCIWPASDISVSSSEKGHKAAEAKTRAMAREAKGKDFSRGSGSKDSSNGAAGKDKNKKKKQFGQNPASSNTCYKLLDAGDGVLDLKLDQVANLDMGDTGKNFGKPFFYVRVMIPWNF